MGNVLTLACEKNDINTTRERDKERESNIECHRPCNFRVVNSICQHKCVKISFKPEVRA